MKITWINHSNGIRVIRLENTPFKDIRIYALWQLLSFVTEATTGSCYEVQCNLSNCGSDWLLEKIIDLHQKHTVVLIFWGAKSRQSKTYSRACKIWSNAFQINILIYFIHWRTICPSLRSSFFNSVVYYSVSDLIWSYTHEQFLAVKKHDIFEEHFSLNYRNAYESRSIL